MATMQQIPFHRPCQKPPCPGHSPQCHTVLGKIPGTSCPGCLLTAAPSTVPFVPWEAQRAVWNIRTPLPTVSPLASPNILFILREAPKSNSELELLRHRGVNFLHHFKWDMKCHLFC